MNRIYSIAFLLGFFMCHFVWGNHSEFLLKMQYEVLFDSKDTSLMHPLIIAPAIGELVLLISLFKPNKNLILTGMVLLGCLVVFVLLAGIFSAQTKMIVSTLPFILTSLSFVRNYKKLS